MTLRVSSKGILSSGCLILGKTIEFLPLIQLAIPSGKLILAQCSSHMQGGRVIVDHYRPRTFRDIVWQFLMADDAILSNSHCNSRAALN